MTKCEYCGKETKDTNGIADDEYMLQSHYLLECEKIPEQVHQRLSKPWLRK